MATITHTLHDLESSRETTSVFGSFFQRLSVSWRRAGLRERLAFMDDKVLLDIGIAEDELDRVHRREAFTPRAWAARGARID